MTPRLDRSKFNRTSLLHRNVKARVKLLRARAPQGNRATRAFILGCGRSGTTILGEMLDLHAGITYFYEPKGDWALVDANTDIMKRYFPWKTADLLEADDADKATKDRFERLFQATTPVILDKSPDGVFRLDFLSALDPSAKFIHIVRDGPEVAESIADRSKISHPLFGRHRNNGWWGIDDAKWQFLCRVARRRSYIEDETAEAQTDAQRGLCEWLLGLNEIRMHREALGDRLLEIRYPDLIGDTRFTLERVVTFLQLEPDEEWLRAAASAIRPQGKRKGSLAIESQTLTDELARARADYGFTSWSH